MIEATDFVAFDRRRAHDAIPAADGGRLARRCPKCGIPPHPAFSILGLAAAIEALFIANWLSGRPLYAWRSLSREGGAVRTSSGLRFAVDGAIAGPASYDAVFVLASFEPKENARDAKTRAWLRRLARYGTELGGIATGSEILAAAGLLDGAEVAVHWDNLQGFREVYPQCHAVAQLFTMSPGRLTCAGESAVLDMMLQWIGGITANRWPRRSPIICCWSASVRPQARSRPRDRHPWPRPRRWAIRCSRGRSP